jgi:hypothetical protein
MPKQPLKASIISISWPHEIDRLFPSKEAPPRLSHPSPAPERSLLSCPGDLEETVGTMGGVDSQGGGDGVGCAGELSTLSSAPQDTQVSEANGARILSSYSC